MSLSTMAQKASRFLECCVCVQDVGLQKQNALRAGLELLPKRS